MSFAAVRKNSKYAVRDLLWLALNRHKPGSDPNICIFGSPRSGTTLMRGIIGSNRGVKYVDQPFSVYTASPYQLRLFPVFDGSQTINPDDEEKAQIREYIGRIISGDSHINEPLRPWRRDFHARSNRLVFKITDAHYLAPWLTAEFNMSSIVCFRHPISQSLSMIRNGWGIRAKAFLRNAWFVDKYLNDSQYSMCQDTLRSESILNKHVLGWALENLGFVQSIAERPTWHFVTYEGFLSEPGPKIEDWARSFSLPDIDAMKTAVGKRSLSVRRLSSRERKRAIDSQDKTAMISSWKSKVDNDAERSAMAILEALEIDLYRYGDVMPRILTRPAGSGDLN